MGQTRGLRKYRIKTFKRKTKLSHIGRFPHKRKSKKSRKVSRRDKHGYRTVTSTSRMKNRKTRRKMSGGSTPVEDQYYFYTSIDPDSSKELNEIIKITRVEDNGDIYFRSQTYPFPNDDFLTRDEFTEMHNNEAFQILGPLEESDKERKDILILRGELREKLRKEILQRKLEQVASPTPPPPTPPPPTPLPPPPPPEKQQLAQLENISQADTAEMVSNQELQPTGKPSGKPSGKPPSMEPVDLDKFYQGDPKLDALAARRIEKGRAKRFTDLLAETHRGLNANKARNL